MITKAKLRSEVVRCLKAGPPKWQTTAVALSEETQWLIDRIDPSGDRGRLAVDFADAFPDWRFHADWPEMSDLLREAFDVLTCQLHGHQRWEQDKDLVLREAFPAQELLTVIEPEPKGWRERWVAAGGQVVGGRCVAMKNDPAWRRFSDFGKPYEPFEWEAKLSTTEMDAAEAESLGVPKVKRTPRAKPKETVDEGWKVDAPAAAQANDRGCLVLVGFVLLVGLLVYWWVS